MKKMKILVGGSLETVRSLINFLSDAGHLAQRGHRGRRLFVPAHLMPELLQQGGFGMRNDFDFAPYRRSAVGFDHLFDLLETGMRGEASDGYPPFDIARDGENSYTITLAVAGFRPGEIEIVAQRNQLSVTGKPAEDTEQRAYLHRGIARRAFERRFQLADFIEVGEAQFENGLLSIALRRVIPEAMKPRKIAIGKGTEASGGNEVAPPKALEAA
jgi:molecular chaperone IbpA